MRDYGTAVNSHLASLSGVHVRHLVWIEARLRSTGEIDPAGFWNGNDVREFVVGGETRAYQGAGTLLNIAPIIGEIGIAVRMQRLSLSKMPPSVRNLLNLYELRFARIEVHKVHFHPVKGVQIGDPVRILKGTIDEMPQPTAAEGGSAPIDVTVATAARALTRRLTVKKSDAAQRLINPADKGRLYAAISGAVGVFWGIKHSRGTPPPTRPPRDRNPGENPSTGGGTTIGG